jgi:hypothetical protein
MRVNDQIWKCSLLLAAVLAGCGGNGNANNGAADMAMNPCSRGTVESDLQASPWKGPGLDANGNIPPGQYVVSSTYVQLKPGVTAEFMQLFGSVQPSLLQSPGMVAARFGQSATCGSARTLVVWSDIESMYSFVTGPAHAAAMPKIGDISRGNGGGTHFDDDGSGATFANAASQLANAPSTF